MKLYYSAGSCSTSCHITLEEAGLKYEAIELDFDKPEDAAKVDQLNPMGTLPIFVTDQGKQLDQNFAIHVFAADLAPAKNLLPPQGSFERIEALNWLSFVAADLHRAVGGMFSIPSISPDKNIQSAARTFQLVGANRAISTLNDRLAGKDFILGKNFSVVDAYAFVVLGWTKWLEIPLTQYANVTGYLSRVAARPAVAKVLKDEGLT